VVSRNVVCPVCRSIVKAQPVRAKESATSSSGPSLARRAGKWTRNNAAIAAIIVSVGGTSLLIFIIVLFLQNRTISADSGILTTQPTGRAKYDISGRTGPEPAKATESEETYKAWLSRKVPSRWTVHRVTLSDRYNISSATFFTYLGGARCRFSVSHIKAYAWVVTAEEQGVDAPRTADITFFPDYTYDYFFATGQNKKWTEEITPQAKELVEYFRSVLPD
jgi:hypothetical protein